MNVFIVEDTAIMLENLLSVLFDIPGVTVVGQAVGGAGAVERIDALRPDLVILDIGLRNGAGIGMLERLKKCHPDIKAMVLTGCTDEFYTDRCKRAGADYFFDKAFQLTWVRAALRQWGEASAPDGELGVWQVSGWRNDPATV
ncbi:MAG: response regulator transcription factor [Gallionella sp.]|nr:response regulator transcription factor [Gallionella sp.]